MAKTIIRMSEEVYAKLKEVAEQEQRSINNMMVYIIREYLKNK